MGSKFLRFARFCANHNLLHRLPATTSFRTYASAIDVLPRASYGGRHTVALIPGDGAGPELMGHVKHILQVTGAPVDFEEVTLNKETHAEDDMNEALLAVKRTGVALKGILESQFDEVGFQRSFNVEMRSELDLFANVVMCKSQPGLKTRHDGIDIVIIRENTEGEYSSLEHESAEGVVESLKIITREKSERIARYAFEFAKNHSRKKVTAVHKANIMKLGDGLFLDTCKHVAAEYPEIHFEGMIVDNCSMQLVSRPQQFDVMVLPNLYGNIISNIGAGLVGGAGVVAGSNLGDRYAVFETGVRSSACATASTNETNPAGIIIASCYMLRHLGLTRYADKIQTAVYKTLNESKVHTPDLGGTAKSSDFVNCVLSHV